MSWTLDVSIESLGSTGSVVGVPSSKLVGRDAPLP